MLSDNDISWELSNGYLVVAPLAEGAVQPASIDLLVEVDGPEHVPPLTRCLASTVQYVEIPNYLAAEVRVRSTAARRGWIVPPTLVDPGFRGNITLEFFNSDRSPLLLPADGMIQLILFRLDSRSSGYNGRYQDQKGVTPARKPKQ
jgi:dCTP deaminase